jgi:undecaprenyl-diphosphatase
VVRELPQLPADTRGALLRGRAPPRAAALPRDGAQPRGGARRRLVLGIAAAYAAAWAIGVGVGYGLKGTHSWDGGARWERDALVYFHAQSLPRWLDSIMLATPLIGTNLVILPVMLVLGLWLWRVRHEPLIAIHLLVVSIGSLSLNPAMKYLLDRDRPELFPPRGMFNWASYPSGHLILTTALYFTGALMLWRARRWRWPFVAAAFVVLVTCYSRLYLSVHWPTDLIGGMLIGLVWLIGTWKAFTSFDARRARRRATPQ